MARLQVDMCCGCGDNFLGINTGQFRENPIGEPFVWLGRSEGRILRLGWGPLDIQDLARIAGLLRGDELMILVPQREAFDLHDFPSEEEVQVSPVEFTVANCQYIICPDQLLTVASSVADSRQKQIYVEGVSFKTLPRSGVNDFIRHPQPATPETAAAA